MADNEDDVIPEEALPPVVRAGEMRQRGVHVDAPSIEDIVGQSSGDNGALVTAPAPAPDVSPLEYAEAAGAGAGRGLTLGTSDLALIRSGLVTPEKLQELKNKAPLTSAASEFGGSIAGIAGMEALSGGLATPLAGAEGAGALARIGVALGKNALIGGALGVGNQISEDALGDKETTAEKLLASGGMGALLGGATGGLFQGAGEVAEPLLSKISDATGQISDKLATFAEEHGANPRGALEKGVGDLTDTLEEAKTAGEDLGKKFHGTDNDGLRHQESDFLAQSVPAAAAKDAAGKLVGDLETKISDMAGDLGDSSPIVRRANKILAQFKGAIADADTSTDLLDSANEARSRLGSTLSDIRGTTDVDKNIASGHIGDMFDAVKSHIENDFGAAGARSAEVTQSLSSKFTAEQGLVDSGLARRIPARQGGGIEFKTNGIRSLARDLVSGRPEAQGKLSAVKEWIDGLNQFGEQVQKSASSIPDSNTAAQFKSLLQTQADTLQGISGKTDRLVAAQEAVNAAKPQSGLIQGLLARHIGDRGAELLAHPVENVATLSEMAKRTSQVTAKMAKGAKAFFNAPLGAEASNAAVTDAIESNPVGGSTVRGKSGFAERHAELNQMAANPQILQDRISKRIGKIASAAPVTSTIIATKASQAANHLASAMPKQQSPDLLQPSLEAPVPNDVQLAAAEDRHRIAHDPLSINKSLAAGTLSQTEVDTYKTLFPKMYQEHVDMLAKEAVNSKTAIPYDKRLQLAMFMGQATDASLLPQNLSMLQSNFTNDQTGEPAPGPQSHSRLNTAKVEKLKTADNMKTPFQSVETA